MTLEIVREEDHSSEDKKTGILRQISSLKLPILETSIEPLTNGRLGFLIKMLLENGKPLFLTEKELAFFLRLPYKTPDQAISVAQAALLLFGNTDRARIVETQNLLFRVTKKVQQAGLAVNKIISEDQVKYYYLDTEAKEAQNLRGRFVLPDGRIVENNLARVLINLYDRPPKDALFSSQLVQAVHGKLTNNNYTDTRHLISRANEILAKYRRRIVSTYHPSIIPKAPEGAYYMERIKRTNPQRALDSNSSVYFQDLDKPHEWVESLERQQFLEEQRQLVKLKASFKTLLPPK